jgi:uncharacterized BrkB/YihY/UPF0761 family membrane protein
VRDVARATHGHDMALYAAAVTFYATVGLIPLLLLSLFLAGQLLGSDMVQDLAAALPGCSPTSWAPGRRRASCPPPGRP